MSCQSPVVEILEPKVVATVLSTTGSSDTDVQIAVLRLLELSNHTFGIARYFLFLRLICQGHRCS